MSNPFRQAARAMQPQASIYHGAQFDRLNYDWVMTRLSADQSLRFDLQTLRNRARELVINNSSAAAIPPIFGENVVGKDGILMQPMNHSTREILKKGTNEAISECWTEWAEAGNCTADGRASLIDFQRMVVEGECVDGEILIHVLEGFDNPWGFALELLDPDQLDIYYNIAPTAGTNGIRMGVEQDKYGRPTFYHLWTQHPTDPQFKERVKVPADEIIHLFIQRRVRQSRGVPWFGPVIFDLKMLGGYRESELVAARASAGKMGFIEPNQDAMVPTKPKEGRTTETWQGEPGTIERLMPGESFKEWDPKHPTTAFEHFDKAILRSIATALRVSYISASGDLTQTSFSSGRVGLLGERAVFQAMQKRLIARVLQPIYRRWLKMALLSGALDLPTTQSKTLWDVVWHPRAFPWIDPVKDINEKERLLGMGATSLTRICAEQGVDFEQIMRERRHELDLGEEYGVPLIIATGTSQRGVNVDTVQESETDEGKPPAGSDDGENEDESEQQPAKPAKPKARLLLSRVNGGGR